MKKNLVVVLSFLLALPFMSQAGTVSPVALGQYKNSKGCTVEVEHRLGHIEIMIYDNGRGEKYELDPSGTRARLPYGRELRGDGFIGYNDIHLGSVTEKSRQFLNLVLNHPNGQLNSVDSTFEVQYWDDVDHGRQHHIKCSDLKLTRAAQQPSFQPAERKDDDGDGSL